MATPNWAHLKGVNTRTALSVAAATWALTAAAAEAPGSPAPELERLERVRVEATQRWQQQSNDVTLAWQLGRACFDVADATTNNTRRAEAARQGMAACRAALARDAKSAPAYYYLGLNLGQLARTRPLSAVGMLDQIESAWLKAIALDETFDFAGPHRSIGVLYRDAPGWPISLGSRKKALEHLAKAVELSPDYPDNRLHLLEAWLDWGRADQARAVREEVGQVITNARKRLKGKEWDATWRDWDSRWEKIRSRLSGE